MWDGYLTKKAMYLTSIQLLQTPWQKRKTTGNSRLEGGTQKHPWKVMSLD